jgi:hypothetical protein
MKEIKLPSGAVLKITPAPFAEARALYQACLEEFKSLKLDPEADVDANLYKDLFCAALASKKIEACIWKCLSRVIYNDGSGDLKVTEDTFEPVNRRDDYITVCYEVASENIRPFMKSLYAQYGQILATVQSSLASRLTPTLSSSISGSPKPDMGTST